MEVVAFILINVLSRILPHLPNATSVGASAVFAGSKYGIKKAWVIILGSLLITDLLLGLHPVMWATYGSFLTMAVIGQRFAKRTSPVRIILVLGFSSCLFFLLTNFAVWLNSASMYPKTVAGLIDCYVMGLPFFRNTILGDLFFGGVFFGGFELVKVIGKRCRLALQS
jgi:hypothetical protein